MVNLFNENKKVFVAKEKPKNELYSLIYFYLRLQNQEPNQTIARRYLKDCSDLLKLGSPAEIKLRCIEIKKYAEKQGISWSLNYVIKSWGKEMGNRAELVEKAYDKQLEAEYERNNRKQKQLADEWERELLRREKPLK